MDIRKFLEISAEAELLEAKKKKESTAQKDDKAEKAGKKVAKDIEYDEGHKGKDDEKAEKAGKKVTKDIEYDDKKDSKKKKSLKDWFEHVEKSLINESDLALPIMGKDGKAVSTQPGFLKMQGDTSPAGKAMAAALKDMVAKKQIQVVAPIEQPKPQQAQQQQQQNTMQPNTNKPVTGATTTTPMKEEMLDEKAPPGMEDVVLSLKKKYPGEEGRAYAIAWSMYNKKHGKKNEGAEDNPPPPADTGEMLDEKWAGDAEVKPTGQYKDKTKEELKAMLAKLHKSGPHGKDSPAAKKMRQINFALRAKGGWKKGEGAAMKEESMDESGLQAYLGKKKYGDEGMKALQKAGREGASKEKMAQIRAKHDKLDEEGVAEGSFKQTPGQKQYGVLHSQLKSLADSGQINTPAGKQKAEKMIDAIQQLVDTDPSCAGSTVPSKKIWLSEQGDEKAKNPYAIGMAQAMKSAGDKPPLKKSTITKAHDIAKSIKKKTDEAEIPSSGPDYGAGLGAGRSDKVIEGAKPDFLDLDKDGNKKETMKKAAADKKKQKVKESMNTLEAAYHEGKSHGLSKHGYACRYNEGSEEHKRYHDGFKEGLDECYGLQPNRGLVVSEVEDEVPATVPGMADQAAGLGEMDKTAYMQHKAKSTPGDTFKAFGQTFKDKEVLEMDAFAFESLDKQLNALLTEGETVNEGLSVNMSQGLGGMGDDSVSVTATADDAGKLLDFIKQVGLGGLGGEQAGLVGGSEPAVISVSDYGAPKFGGYEGHDGMKDLMNKIGGEDYEDEGSHGEVHAHEETCNECGMTEAKCGCDENTEMVDEVETPDQMTDEMAEDSAGADEVAMTTADEDAEAEEDKTKPAFGGATNEDTGSEAQGGPASGVEAGDEAEEAEATMKESAFKSLFQKLAMLAEESTEKEDEKAEKAGKKVTKDIEYDDKKDKKEKVDEWANDAGKKGTDQAFERDIEFMTKVIAGGLNKPKVTGQTTIPVIASQDARNGDEDVGAWKKLAGLDK